MKTIELNKKLPLLILVFALLFFCQSNISAQKNEKKITIKGSVRTAFQYPVSNAFIVVDGQKTGIVTNAKGNYRIRVFQSAEKIGVVSFIYGIIEEDIESRKYINFTYNNNEFPLKAVMYNKAEEKEQSVNTGYNYVKQKNVTSNIAKIDGTDPKFASFSSVAEMIEREVSGVRATSSGFIIHGTSTLQGSVPALIIVDGVPTDNIAGIVPSMVESIEVIKDGSAAIFGTRGFGGAILITTRK